MEERSSRFCSKLNSREVIYVKARVLFYQLLPITRRSSAFNKQNLMHIKNSKRPLHKPKSSNITCLISETLIKSSKKFKIAMSLWIPA